MHHSLSKRAITTVICALVQDELDQLRAQAPRSDINYVVNEQSVLELESRSSESLHAIPIDSFEWMAIATRIVNYFSLDSSGLEDYLLRKNKLSDWAEVVVKSRELASTDLRLSTSGSTGKPKVVTHDYEALVAEVHFFIDYFAQLTITPKRIVSVVPPHHIYGFLFSVLLPDLLDIPVIRGMAAHARAQQGLHEHDVLVAFPSFLNQLVKRTIGFAPQVTVLTSTGPCPQDTLEALTAEGAHQVIEIYGSTDTGGIGVRHVPGDPFELLPRWRRADSSEQAADPVQSSETTLNHIIDIRTEQLTLVPDYLAWQPKYGERHFLPRGRTDQAISIHGINVFPQRVAETLTQHASVQTARVRLLPDGSGLKALIVPEPSLKTDATLIPELKAIARQQLSALEQPKHYQMADSIPTNSYGKETDWPMEPHA